MTTDQTSVPDGDAKDNKGPLLAGVSVMLDVIALVFIVLRFYSHRLQKQRLLAQDLLILVSFVFSTAIVIILICNVALGGLGQHVTMLESVPEKLVLFAKLLFSIQFLWAMAMTFVRLSMLQLFRHLFPRSRWLQIACHILMAATILWTLADWIFFFLCRPFTIGQDNAVPGKKCGPMNPGYLTIQSFNVFLNVCVGFLPAPILFGLQIPLSTKIAITIMFALAALYVMHTWGVVFHQTSVCLVSAARIVNFHIIFDKIHSDFSKSDFTYDGSILYFFTVMEPLVICSLACIPYLCPVADKVCQSSLGSRTKSLLRSLRTNNTITQDRNSHTGSSEGLHPGQARGGRLSNRPSERTLVGVDHQSQGSDIEMQPAVSGK